MQHFPLLGSVFRQVALRASASHDFEQPLKDAGMIPESQSAQNMLRMREKTAPRGNRKSRTLKSPIVTPFVHKRVPNTQSDEPPPYEVTMGVPRPPSEIIVGLSSDEQPSEEAVEESPDVIVGVPEPGKARRPKVVRPKTVAEVRVKTASSATDGQEVSNVFYRKCVSATEPPSESNFVQLNEVLDRSLEQVDKEDVLGQNESIEMVFLEMIRQYFIECSEQGRLLDKIRLFFESLANHVPKLKTKLEEELAKLQAIITQNREEVSQMRSEMAPIEEKKAEIENVIAQLKNDYEQMSAQLDALNKSIAFTLKDASNLKVEADDMDVRVAEKQNHLVELDDKLRALEEESARITQDSVKVAEELIQLNQEVNAKQTQYQQARAVVDGRKGQLEQLNSEIEELEKSLQEQEKMAADTQDARVQVDLLTQPKSAALQEARKKRQERGGRVSANKTKLENMFQGDKDLNIPPEGIVVASYDDFALLKQLILDNPDMFQLSDGEIKAAEDGSIDLLSVDGDNVGLFASRMISRAIRRAIHMYPRFEVPTQTLSKQIKWRTPGVWGDGRFLSLIPGDYSSREPRTMIWLIKEIRKIYNEKLQLDLADLAKKKSLTCFPEFIIDFAQRNHKLESMGHQYCWDLYITGTEFRERSLEVGTFMDAVDEKIAAEPLCFALKCRDDVLKIGAVVNRRADEENEQMTDYYLSQDQVFVCLPKWWKKRYRNTILQRVMDLSIARPAPHLEAVKRYVSLNDIFATMADEFLKDNIARMHELLHQGRIIPRLSEPGFFKFFRSMMPYLSDLDCRNLYRSTVVKTPIRVDVSQRKFRRVFRSQSLLASEDAPPERDGKLDDLLYSVKEEWNKKKNMFTLIRKFFEGLSEQDKDNIELKSLLTDAVRFEQMLVQAIAVHNPVEACFNYFQLTFVLDLLFSTMDTFNVDLSSSALVSLENCAREFWHGK